MEINVKYPSVIKIDMVEMKKNKHLCIYLHWAMQLTECLFKTKEHFTTVYFSPHSSYMLSAQISFPYGKGKAKIKKDKNRKTTQSAITQMICKKKPHIFGKLLSVACRNTKNIKIKIHQH